MLKMTVLLRKHSSIGSSQPVKLIEDIMFPVISQLQNKSQLTFRQLNAFNVKLQL